MELRNEKGEVTQVADNLTIKEVLELGYSIDLCDEAFDPNEHWSASSPHQGSSEMPES